MTPKKSQSSAPVLTACRTYREPREGGFTLVELVLAVAILGGSLLALLSVRITAVDRANTYTKERHIQRLAQQKLDEVMYGLEEELEGQYEAEYETHWAVSVQNLGDPELPLYACTITVTYPGTFRGEEETFELSSWIYYPSENSVLHSAIESSALEGGF